MQSTTDAILILSEDLGIATVSTSQQIRLRADALLAAASELPVITDKPTADMAAGLLRDIKQITSLVEDARKTVKAPVLELAKAIDVKAEQLTGDLAAKAHDISRSLGGWNAAQEELKRRAERAAQEETSRIMREAQAKIEHAQEHSRTPAGAAVKIEQIEARAMAEVAATRQELVQPYADKKTTGTATRTVVEIEVRTSMPSSPAFPCSARSRSRKAS